MATARAAPPALHNNFETYSLVLLDPFGTDIKDYKEVESDIP
jgi:hypothetical protein